MMKLAFTLVLLVFTLSLSGGDMSKSVTTEESLTSIPGGRGILYVTRYHPSVNEDGGRVLYWEDHQTGERFNLNTLSGLEEAATRELESLNPSGDSERFGLLIGRIASKFAVSDGELMLDEDRLRKFLSALRQQEGEKAFEHASGLLNASGFEMTDNNWSVRFFVITGLGAVESRALYGKLNPFQIERYEMKLVAPIGSIPRIKFFP